MMAPKAPTSPAQRYYITPEGGRPQPVREASADPGQNPWCPGPKARWRHQPSRPSGRVNLREYSPAPPRSRSRPRHRRPTTTLAPKGETTHYDLCVALLLQIMFAVHATGASNLSPLRTFGPAGRQPSSPKGACPLRLTRRVIPQNFKIGAHGL